MMMPRLKLLRELLSEDGAIFISIDDNEFHRLRVLCDEIFNDENFVSEFIWKSRQNVDSRSLNGVSNDHEYILCYSKNNNYKIRGKVVDISKYKNPDNDPRGAWMSSSLDGLATAEMRPNLHYTIVNEKTKKKYNPSPDNGWRYQKSKVEELIKERRILWPKNDNSKPRFKRYLNERLTEFTGFSSALDTVYTVQGTRELREIMEEETIKFPKPVDLIKLVLEQSTDKNSIILDSFAGSGTTAQAVLELNKEDEGNRKFILVEQEEYANTITAERVRRVIKGVKTAKNERLKNGLGGTFSYFELGPSIEMESILTGNSLPTYEELARYIFYTATGTEFDEKKINRKTNFIGATKDYELYMHYEPNIEWLKQNALTLDGVRDMPKYTSKQRLVFAPAKYVDDETCRYNRIDFCQLPYEIYRIQK